MEWLEYIVFSIFRLFRRLRLRRIIRVGTSTRRFTEYFKGFEKVEAVRGIFGEETEKVLRNLKIEFMGFGGYMGVDDTNGHLMVNARYLNSGNRVDIYLDVIHELYHVKQFMEGKELFDSQYEYIERPTEIEAYRYTVQEARRLGLSDERICQYLKTEWMSDSDLKRLAKALNVAC
jgi:hypothetical protein